MKTNRIALIAALATGLLLAACGGGERTSDDSTTNTEMTTDNLTVPEPENLSEVPAEAPAAPRIDNANTEAQPDAAPVLSDDQQTRDDADATGMTARVSRDEGGNESQPAE
jgi:ABC-type glycerol-3-phosphate transport system substrate-binding protein